MHSSMIGKFEKAMRYAHEHDRLRIDRLEASFAGDNGSHRVSLDADQWRCTCHLFTSWGACVHTLATQKMLREHLSEEAMESAFYQSAGEVATPA